MVLIRTCLIWLCVLFYVNPNLCILIFVLNFNCTVILYLYTLFCGVNPCLIIIVYIAHTSHQWGRLPHTCINKWKICEQTRRPFIVFSFSTTFSQLLVNQSFNLGIGAPYSTNSNLRSNPSSGLCINFICITLCVSFISHLGV